jgi:hypothetical protein
VFRPRKQRVIVRRDRRQAHHIVTIRPAGAALPSPARSSDPP